MRRMLPSPREITRSESSPRLQSPHPVTVDLRLQVSALCGLEVLAQLLFIMCIARGNCAAETEKCH